jgi:hypothetical protein
LTVRIERASPARSKRPSHPAQRIVTIGRTPLLSGRDGFVKS